MKYSITYSILNGALVFLMALGPSNAHAQITDLATGTRVRVAAPTLTTRLIVGRVDRLSADSLVLKVPFREASSRAAMASRGWRRHREGYWSLRIPRDAIERWEVSVSRKRKTGEGVILGALVGGLTLGLTVYAVEKNREDDCEEGRRRTEAFSFECLQIFTPAASFAMGTLIGGLVGAGVGAVIGRNTYSDRWESLPVEVSLGVLPDAGFSKPNLMFSLRLSLNGR